jgi:hypothetical protein
MKGFIKYNEDQAQQALDLVAQINDCLGLPDGGTTTWSYATALCNLNPQTSGYTDFWGIVVKVDTDELANCLTQQQKDNVIQLPEGLNICGSQPA